MIHKRMINRQQNIALLQPIETQIGFNTLKMQGQNSAFSAWVLNQYRSSFGMLSPVDLFFLSLLSDSSFNDMDEMVNSHPVTENYVTNIFNLNLQLSLLDYLNTDIEMSPTVYLQMMESVNRFSNLSKSEQKQLKTVIRNISGDQLQRTSNIEAFYELIAKELEAYNHSNESDSVVHITQNQKKRSSHDAYFEHVDFSDELEGVGTTKESIQRNKYMSSRSPINRLSKIISESYLYKKINNKWNGLFADNSSASLIEINKHMVFTTEMAQDIWSSYQEGMHSESNRIYPSLKTLSHINSSVLESYKYYLETASLKRINRIYHGGFHIGNNFDLDLIKAVSDGDNTVKITNSDLLNKVMSTRTLSIKSQEYNIIERWSKISTCMENVHARPLDLVKQSEYKGLSSRVVQTSPDQGERHIQYNGEYLEIDQSNQWPGIYVKNELVETSEDRLAYEKKKSRTDVYAFLNEFETILQTILKSSLKSRQVSHSESVRSFYLFLTTKTNINHNVKSRIEDRLNSIGILVDQTSLSREERWNTIKKTSRNLEFANLISSGAAITSRDNVELLQSLLVELDTIVSHAQQRYKLGAILKRVLLVPSVQRDALNHLFAKRYNPKNESSIEISKFSYRNYNASNFMENLIASLSFNSRYLPDVRVIDKTNMENSSNRFESYQSYNSESFNWIETNTFWQAEHIKPLSFYVNTKDYTKDFDRESNTRYENNSRDAVLEAFNVFASINAYWDNRRINKTGWNETRFDMSYNHARFMDSHDIDYRHSILNSMSGILTHKHNFSSILKDGKTVGFEKFVQPAGVVLIQKFLNNLIGIDYYKVNTEITDRPKKRLLDASNPDYQEYSKNLSALIVLHNHEQIEKIAHRPSKSDAWNADRNYIHLTDYLNKYPINQFAASENIYSRDVTARYFNDHFRKRLKRNLFHHIEKNSFLNEQYDFQDNWFMDEITSLPQANHLWDRAISEQRAYKERFEFDYARYIYKPELRTSQVVNSFVPLLINTIQTLYEANRYMTLYKQFDSRCQDTRIELSSLIDGSVLEGNELRKDNQESLLDNGMKALNHYQIHTQQAHSIMSQNNWIKSFGLILNQLIDHEFILNHKENSNLSIMTWVSMLRDSINKYNWTDQNSLAYASELFNSFSYLELSNSLLLKTAQGGMDKKWQYKARPDIIKKVIGKYIVEPVVSNIFEKHLLEPVVSDVSRKHLKAIDSPLEEKFYMEIMNKVQSANVRYLNKDRPIREGLSFHMKSSTLNTIKSQIITDLVLTGDEKVSGTDISRRTYFNQEEKYSLGSKKSLEISRSEKSEVQSVRLNHNMTVTDSTVGSRSTIEMVFARNDITRSHNPIILNGVREDLTQSAGNIVHDRIIRPVDLKYVKQQEQSVSNLAQKPQERPREVYNSGFDSTMEQMIDVSETMRAKNSMSSEVPNMPSSIDPMEKIDVNKIFEQVYKKFEKRIAHEKRRRGI